MSSRVEELRVSKGNKKSGSGNPIASGENMVYGNYYEFVYEVYWEEEGDVVDPYYEDERVGVINDHLIQITDLVWADFLANETLMEYVYPQYIETEITSCSELIQGPYGDFHYEIHAVTRVQTVCIKNPINWVLVAAIVTLLIKAGVIIAVGYFAALCLHYACILIHGWPPAVPVAPPEGASEWLWAKYYEAYKIFTATQTVQNLIWYIVLGCVCVGMIFVIVYYFSSKAGREKIITRIAGKKKK